MSFVLLDWTRMGKGYCLAGAVLVGPGVRVVRPLAIPLQRPEIAPRGVLDFLRSLFFRAAPPEGDRAVAWPPHLLVGRSRWEVFDLASPRPASPHRPHLEDTWVAGLRPRDRLATADQRRAILTATAAPTAAAIFGAAIQVDGGRTYLLPGEGVRSLSTVLVPSGAVRFRAGEGSASAKLRVELPLADLGPRSLPVTDHHLLCRAERQAPNPEGQADAVAGLVRQMGETVAVRLGLSRPYSPDGRPPVCWVLANGFFSLADPQP